MRMPMLRAIGRLRALTALAVVATTAGVVLASDHQDTPEVELHPRLDINDVYAFPGATPDRLVLAVTTSSPLTPAGSVGRGFDPGLLYQIKIDNTGDAVEDLVLQFAFDARARASRSYAARPGGSRAHRPQEHLSSSPPDPHRCDQHRPGYALRHPALRRLAGRSLLHRSGAVLPDHSRPRPGPGPLSKIGPKPEATSFRIPAIDFLAGINALAMVVELPESMILPPAPTRTRGSASGPPPAAEARGEPNHDTLERALALPGSARPIAAAACDDP